MNNNHPIIRLAEQVSWAKRYSCLDQEGFNPNSIPGNFPGFVIETDQKQYMFFVAIKSKELDKLLQIENPRNDTWNILVEDVMPKNQIEQLLRSRRKDLRPWFLEPQSQIEYHELLNSILDGIDLERSLISQKPIYQWE